MQRGYARDYYDVWRLLREGNYDLTQTRVLLIRKCKLTAVPFEPRLIFDENRLVDAGQHWETALARLTKDLAPFDSVIRELRKSLGPIPRG
ncbi:MAG: nucleotidyl transferase AbiEii/AbiGii toxin family protein [Euryarchaeota archaeon]|nr:nucleotidyl transferase AbiEii/AbiGii toxin family protein [Euryarchaeota archaeon]